MHFYVLRTTQHLRLRGKVKGFEAWEAHLLTSYVTWEVNFYAYIREFRPLGVMLHRWGKQNLSLYTVDPRKLAHLALIGKAKFVAIYGRPAPVCSSCIYWESRICRYIRSTRASLLISGLAWVTSAVNSYAYIRQFRPLGFLLYILWKQNLSVYTVDPRQFARLAYFGKVEFVAIYGVPGQLAHLRPSLSDLGSQLLCIYTWV